MPDDVNGYAQRLEKNKRAVEIDQLVQFIQQRDIQNARRKLVDLMGKGVRISREIVVAYERLEIEK